jgi:hypothetical protein
LRYSLLHDRGAEGGVHTVFADVPFEQLFLEERHDATDEPIIHELSVPTDDETRESLRILAEYRREMFEGAMDEEEGEG